MRILETELTTQDGFGVNQLDELSATTIKNVCNIFEGYESDKIAYRKRDTSIGILKLFKDDIGALEIRIETGQVESFASKRHEINWFGRTSEILEKGFAVVGAHQESGFDGFQYDDEQWLKVNNYLLDVLAGDFRENKGKHDDCNCSGTYYTRSSHSSMRGWNNLFTKFDLGTIDFPLLLELEKMGLMGYLACAVEDKFTGRSVEGDGLFHEPLWAGMRLFDDVEVGENTCGLALANYSTVIHTDPLLKVAYEHYTQVGDSETDRAKLKQLYETLNQTFGQLKDKVNRMIEM